eukprot:jgi/Botrbrau1/15083/Bobra.0221s0002.1
MVCCIKPRVSEGLYGVAACLGLIHLACKRVAEAVRDCGAPASARRSPLDKLCTCL